jgi:hypothetical protein
MQIIEVNPAEGVLNELQREKVREQLNRLLDSHQFKNSRRYPALLRFIVEETLEGRGEFLKERLLGVHVFQRPADYDTAADPIVRVTVAEIRKRIAQYYHDEEHDGEIRIELPPGHYTPEFREGRDGQGEHLYAPKAASKAVGTNGHPAPDTTSEPSLLLVPTPDVPAAAVSVREPRSLANWVAWGSAVAVVAVIALGVAARWTHRTAQDEMWAPILAQKQTVLFCLPTGVGKKSKLAETSGDAPTPGSSVTSPTPNPPSRTFLDYEALGENVVYSDVLATLDVVNVLSAHHRDYRLRLNSSTTLEDLRYGPDILIGGLDNEWTLRSLAPLPYRFAGSDEDRYWIADRKNPNDKRWSLDLKLQYAAVTRDYAIIARLHNEQTGQPEIIVAGIGMSGTAAAGDFLGNEQRMEELRQRVGAGFKDRDFEVVLSTDVVNGIAGAPKILAVSIL